MSGEPTARDPGTTQGFFQVLEPGQKLLVVFNDKVLPSLLAEVKRNLETFMEGENRVAVASLPNGTVYILDRGDNTIEVTRRKDLEG